MADVKYSKKYQPLFKVSKKIRYKHMAGGRGSGKSHALATYLLRETYKPNEVILYTRWTMTSAKDSIIPEFIEKIELLEVDADFEITTEQIINKVWQQLKREGYVIARCTVARLMQKLGIQGVWRGKNKQTTRSRDDQKRADDLVKRNFNADHPDQLWVADFTYIQTHSGWVYTAFIIDVFSQSIS